MMSRMRAVRPQGLETSQSRNPGMSAVRRAYRARPLGRKRLRSLSPIQQTSGAPTLNRIHASQESARQSQYQRRTRRKDPMTGSLLYHLEKYRQASILLAYPVFPTLGRDGMRPGKHKRLT